MAGKQVTELDALPSFTDTSLLPVHNGAGLKKGLLSQLASYLGNKFSNPNLLINSDFKINQRGATSYTSGYTVDRWKVSNGTVEPQSNGISVTLSQKGQFIQLFENTLSGTYTATIKVTSITGDCVLLIGSHSLQLNKAGTFTITENGSITGISLYKSTAGTCTINVEYIKLEQGTVATPFVAPNPAEELIKCERFFVYAPEIFFSPYAGSRTSVGNSGQYYQNISGLFPVKMRVNPTVTHRIVRDSSNSTIPEKVSSVGSDNYGISTITMEKTLSYYTLRMIDVKVDAEIY